MPRRDNITFETWGFLSSNHGRLRAAPRGPDRAGLRRRSSNYGEVTILSHCPAGHFDALFLFMSRFLRLSNFLLFF